MVLGGRPPSTQFRRAIRDRLASPIWAPRPSSWVTGKVMSKAAESG